MPKFEPKHLIERVPTGIPGLDTILNGGLLKSGVYVIEGPPGTGKTIMGNQIAFHHVSKDMRALYITLLAESHDRILGYVHTMKFFDTEPIHDRLTYISGYEVLEDGKLSGLMNLIKKEVLAKKVSLIILDGFILTSELNESDLSVKKMIHQLQAFIAMTKCTVLLLTVKDEGAGHTNPGFTMVDGIIELGDYLVGPRAVRELTVRKLRGTNFLRGKHTFDITEDGVVVYPRTEVLLAHPPEVTGTNRTLQKFGVPELDSMLCGGLISGSMTTLLGAPGTGKTLLGLSFLVEGVRRGEPGIYFGFYEPPQRLIEKAEKVGIDIRQMHNDGLIDIVWQPPLEHYLDSLAERLLKSIHKKKAKRVFIDGLEGFKSATVYPDRIGAYLAAVTNELRSMNVTAIFSEETDLFTSNIEMPVKELAAVIENVIYLRYVEMDSQLHRLISILKVRESECDGTIRKFQITGNGISVEGGFESRDRLLSGQSTHRQQERI